MTLLEKKIMSFIEKHTYILFALAVLVLGWGMRYFGFKFESDDMRLYLLKWYGMIADKGISEQVGNYNLPYQFIIYILTKTPIKPIVAYKLVSCVFDVALASISGYIVWLLTETKRETKALIAFTLVFCSPIVILNSAMWGQCDSIYTFFGIAALLLLYKEKSMWSFIMLGIAFAFKLQAIFFVPFFLIYYVCKKNYTIFQFIWVPVMMIVMSLPGILSGRNIIDIFMIYRQQTNTYNRVYINFASIYALLTGNKANYYMFRYYSFLVTVLVLGCGLFICMKKQYDLKNSKIFWAIVLWSLYSVSFFLPNMHERYAYIFEVVSLFYCFITPVGIPLAIISNLASATTYGYYLFQYRAIPLEVMSLISMVMYVTFTWWIFVKNCNVSQKR